MSEQQTVGKIELNSKFRSALQLMENTNQNVFITGKAGTGKSTLLEYFRTKTQKQVAFLAPTGVAAVNIRGQTIHSFFGFKPDITLEMVQKKYRNRSKKGLYKKLESLVIDEISMVRADLLDCVDAFLRLNGPNKGKPFGGIQMIWVGDLYQLPPVVTGVERKLFQQVYPSPYFFDSRVCQNFKLSFVELEKIYRQKDPNFIKILNSVRNRALTDQDLVSLNKRCHADFEPPEGEFFVYLTTTNDLASSINNIQLRELLTPEVVYKGETYGQFESKVLPTSMELKLKVGAQVMLVNNDRLARWVNGTIGQIVAIEPDSEEDVDAIVVELQNKKEVAVYPYTWEMFRYVYNPSRKRVESETVGSFTQYPLILAWALTIHKSQGKTFEKIVIDIGRGTFAHGQTYVALSRCTSLEGIILRKPFQKKHLLTDWRVVKFLTQFQYQLANKKLSVPAKVRMIKKAIREKKTLQMTYLKTNDEKSERRIRPESVGKMKYKEKSFLGVKGYCLSRRDDRVFRVDRILALKVVN